MKARRRRFLRVHPRTLLTIGLASLALGALALLPVARRVGAGSGEASPLRIALLDVSASRARVDGPAGAHERYARRALVGFAERARTAEQDVAVVLFAEEAQLLTPPGTPDALLRLLDGRSGESPLRPSAPSGQDSGSAIDEALRICEGLLAVGKESGARPGWIELFVRGAEDATPILEFTGPHPGLRMARLLAAGTTVEDGDALTTQELRPRPAPDVSVRSLSLPERVAADEDLVLRAEIALRDASLARRGERLVRLNARRRQEGVPDVLSAMTHRIAASAVRGTESVVAVSMNTGPARPGRVEIQLTVSLVGDEGQSLTDRFPENDQRRATARVGETILCTLYGPAEDHAPWTELARVPGFQTRFIDSDSGTAREDLALDLENCDVLCLSDVALDDRAGGVPVRELITFVEGGGGLLVFSGWQTATAWPASLPEESAWALLPLMPADENRKPRDIVFLVDGSGSMRGESFDRVREALFVLTAGAPTNDRMSLNFFTGALTPEILLADGGSGPASKEERRRRLSDLLNARVPGGSTQILTSLEQFAAKRESKRGREALVFLLSDGREFDPFKVSERSQKLRTRFAGLGVRLLPVAVGANADETFLQGLVPEGEVLRRALDFEGLEELFQREVISERVFENDARARLAAPESFPAASPAAIASALLSEEPSAERRVAWRARADARSGADVLLRTPPPADGANARGRESDPLLAIIERGSGLVVHAAFPAQVVLADPEGGRAGIDFGERVALLRQLGRHAKDRDRQPQLYFQGGRLHVTDVPEAWPVEIRGRVLERARGLLSEDRELAEILFTLGDPILGVDPRSHRVAASTSSKMAEVPEGTARRVELEHPLSGQRIASLPWPSQAVPLEFVLPVPPQQRLRLGDWLTASGSSLAPGEGSGSSGSPKLALALLAVGLASLALWAFSRPVPSPGAKALQA